MGLRDRRMSVDQKKPVNGDDPKKLSPADLGWAAFHLRGEFSKYLFSKRSDIPKDKRIEAELSWFISRDCFLANQREQNGPWITLFKDVKKAFSTFWAGISS